jgi:adenine-specific DNA-methyltransferase
MISNRMQSDLTTTPPPFPDTYFGNKVPRHLPRSFLYNGDCEILLDAAAKQGLLFDLCFTSPPYNLSKPYNGYTDARDLQDYLDWQERIITKCVDRLSPTGSICWQVGNYVSNGHVIPLDLELYSIFKRLGLKLRNRVIWHFGHGLHCKKRFSGRYEVVLWYSKTDNYRFNLDPVRVASKYPQKKHFKGPRKGELSGNPLGKNPADVWAIDPGDFWEIPNVKHNHIEKTGHPCQFPAGLVQRFLLALTNPGDIVHDPFLGVGTTAATAAQFKRRFYGSEQDAAYFKTARERVEAGGRGLLPFRDGNKPIYQPPKLKDKV